MLSSVIDTWSQYPWPSGNEKHSATWLMLEPPHRKILSSTYSATWRNWSRDREVWKNRSAKDFRSSKILLRFTERKMERSHRQRNKSYAFIRNNMTVKMWCHCEFLALTHPSMVPDGAMGSEGWLWSLAQTVSMVATSTLMPPPKPPTTMAACQEKECIVQYILLWIQSNNFQSWTWECSKSSNKESVHIWSNVNISGMGKFLTKWTHLSLPQYFLTYNSVSLF